jgi:hypothetical protein
VDHAIEIRHFLVVVCQDGVVNDSPLSVVDIADPAFVRLCIINAEGDYFNIALVELRLEARNFTELGGANGGIVSGVREENDPAITSPRVKVDFPFTRLLSKIGHFIAKLKNHTEISCGLKNRKIEPIF